MCKMDAQEMSSGPTVGEQWRTVPMHSVQNSTYTLHISLARKRLGGPKAASGLTSYTCPIRRQEVFHTGNRWLSQSEHQKDGSTPI